MSCLRLSLKIPPARKAWKILTSKLQKKLPKLRRPSNNKLTYTSTRPLRSAHHHRAVTLRKTAPSRPSNNLKLGRRYPFKKRKEPVFIDKLFKEPNSSVSLRVSEQLVDYKKGKARVVEKSVGAGSSSISTSGFVEIVESGHEINEGRKFESVDSGGDDRDCMWESVGMASPMMRNIDERAEEFIAKFRADMKRQEAMAWQEL